MVVLYSVWYSVSHQLNILSYQINLIRAYNINPRTTPVWFKFYMLKRFRQMFAIYLMLNAIADIMIVTDTSTPWLPPLADEILEFICCIIIGFTFRARDFSPYFERIRRATLDPLRAAAAAANANAAAAAGTNVRESAASGGGGTTINGTNNDDNELLRQDNGRREWQRGMALPEPPEHMFHPARSSIVVFVNPDGRRSSLGSTALEGIEIPTSPGSFLIKKNPEEIENGNNHENGNNQENGV